MRKLIVLVVVVMVAIGVPTVAAGATTSRLSITSCGQVITTDAVLRTDLTCSGTALMVEANGVEVRLAGHTIRSSDGTGVGVRLGGPFPSPAVQGVVLSGGTITGFASGIEVDSASQSSVNRISGTTLTGNTNGVWLACCSATSLDHTTIVGPNGITGPEFNLGVSTVTHSTIKVDEGGLNVAATDSMITASDLSGGAIEAPTGLGFTIQRSKLFGVTVECGDTNVAIADSRVVGGVIQGEGGCYMNMSRDRFIGPGSGTAIQVGGGFSVPSVVADNDFTGWGDAVTVGSFTHVSITGNTFRNNVNGILGCASVWCAGGPITSNRFLDNSGTGLTLTAGTWHVGSNTALHNGGLGIDAQGADLTVIDDGGNSARHNQPPQCIGVVCIP